MGVRPISFDIPHRGPMLWVRADSPAEVLISADHPFMRGGILLRPALVELLAQGAAWQMAQVAAAEGKRVVEGRLVALSAMQFLGDVAAGQRVALRFAAGPAYGQFARVQATAAVNGRVVARGEMTFHVTHDAV